jgi:cyanophycinase
LGEGTVTVCLPESKDSRPAEIVLREGDVADLTALRRIAKERTGAGFPPPVVGKPHVKTGSLILGGGSRMPQEVIRKFIELAGGPDARIIILPTASDPVPKQVSEARMFERAGATNVIVLPQRTREQVESEDFRKALDSARGIWFGGGRQWRFVDAYENTSAIDLFHGVLRRGGVIGGSSAGASIQAEYLARGDPLGNQEIMSEGYERGLGFLPGVAVDQHFSQRKRFEELSRLVATFPQLLGIGIDESTALLVQGRIGTVIGKNAVHFYDRRSPANRDENEALTLRSGQHYDLIWRARAAEEG